MRSPWDSQPARANRSSTLALLSVLEKGPYLPVAALGWYASATEPSAPPSSSTQEMHVPW